MSDVLMAVGQSEVTTISSTPVHPIGTRLFKNGREYVYMQANAALAAGQCVKLVASGIAVTPTTAATDPVLGVAETAVTINYYGFITVRGPATILIATGTSVDAILAPGATAGVMATAPTSTAIRLEKAQCLVQNVAGSDQLRLCYLF